jgi:hypothetical protein
MNCTGLFTVLGSESLYIQRLLLEKLLRDLGLISKVKTPLIDVSCRSRARGHCGVQDAGVHIVIGSLTNHSLFATKG